MCMTGPYRFSNSITQLPVQWNLDLRKTNWGFLNRDLPLNNPSSNIILNTPLEKRAVLSKDKKYKGFFLHK